MDPLTPNLARSALQLRTKRLLIGIPLPALAREIGVSPDLLRAAEAGQYDWHSLPLTALARLQRILDL